MSVTNSLKRFGLALRNLDAGHDYDVFHFWRPLMKTPFIVWRETGERNGFHSDNKKSEMIMSVNIDVFTSDEFDPLIDAVADFLNRNDIPFSIENVDFDETTKVIQYSFSCETVVRYGET